MEKVAKVGGWNYDIDQQKIIWTKGVYDIYGVSINEFDPSEVNPGLQFYHPEDKELLERAFQQTIQTGDPYNLELRFTDANGVQKWVSTSGQAEYQNGEIIRVFGSIMDITESKLAEIAVLESELKMREIFNSTNEAILIYDASTGKILDCNNSTLKIYGYPTKKELIGKGLGDVSINEYPYNEDEAFKKNQEAINKGTQTFDWIAKRRMEANYGLKYLCVILSSITKKEF